MACLQTADLKCLLFMADDLSES